MYKKQDNDDNNQYFTADLDEDINDSDIGWNSEDDDKYGIFFQSNNKTEEIEEDNTGDIPISSLLSSDDEEDDDDNKKDNDDSHKRMIDSIYELQRDTIRNNSNIKKVRYADDIDEAMDEGTYNINLGGSYAANTNAMTYDDIDNTNDSNIDQKLSLNDLMMNDDTLKDKLGNLNHMKTLSKPLENIETERLQRIQGYKTANKKVSRWTPFIQRNNKANTLNFPLNKPGPLHNNINTLNVKFNASNSLEKDLQIF